MYDEAYEILDYLPREAGGESIYISHLWGSFGVLMEKEELVRAFAILPFHLLFMLAVQYKVYRVSAFNKEGYLLKLASCDRLNAGNRKVLEDNPPIPDVYGNILSSCSVRNLSLIQEKQLFGFMQLINVDDATITKAIELVLIRGTYAHANGNIEGNIDGRIDEYLSILREIQPKMCPLNDTLALEWLGEMQPEDSKSDFAETRLASTYLCQADFLQGELTQFIL